MKIEENWVESVLAWRPAGLILTGRHRSPRTLELLRNAGIPVVEIWDLNSKPIDICVGFNHFDSGYEMGRFLATKRYRRIGYVGVEIGFTTLGGSRLDESASDGAAEPTASIAKRMLRFGPVEPLVCIRRGPTTMKTRPRPVPAKRGSDGVPVVTSQDPTLALENSPCDSVTAGHSSALVTVNWIPAFRSYNRDQPSEQGEQIEPLDCGQLLRVPPHAPILNASGGRRWQSALPGP